jgi:predicted metalloprotease with PDZ domain
MKRAKKYFSSANDSMSKMKNWFSTLFIACFIVILSFASISAQVFEATIKVDSVSKIAQVKGSFLKAGNLQSPKNFAFARLIVGTDNLGERISDLTLTDRENRQIPVKKLIAGEYLAENEATNWDYKIDLKQTGDFTSKAHISWLKDEQGILMLGDLLPQFFAKNELPISARIKFILPENWKIIGSKKSDNLNVFEVEDIEKAVFAIGKNWREREIKLGNFAVNLAIFGEWRFSDEEAESITKEILESYKQIFSEFPNEKAQVNFVPVENNFGRWEAETRANTLTIVSGDMAFQKQSVQRLHEQLRHEFFHLWVPNNLALTGNYDWFYEGFTVYQSLKTGIEMNRISFSDFLATLAQAYDFSNFSSQQISLVEASKTRKSGANSSIYAKGMLAAFLCDAAILQKSEGKRAISEVFRQVYQTHRLPNEAQDGNIAVLNILKSHAEFRPIVENYIEGTKKIDWSESLENLGIEEIKENSSVKLKVKDKLKGRQKDLLDKLGYNNWRKISGKSK